MTTVAIFGGSFNPPHIAHVLAAVFVLSMEAEVDELWVVPCFKHPFSKSLASFEDRLAMSQLAFAWLPRVTVSTIERDLGGESRTIRTVRHLRALHPDWSLRLVIGTDIVSEAPRWDSFDEIQRLAPPIVLARKGFTDQDARKSVFPELSSTQIRRAMQQGDVEQVRGWVPSGVLGYMLDRSLYRAKDEP